LSLVPEQNQRRVLRMIVFMTGSLGGGIELDVIPGSGGFFEEGRGRV
jgi:hypothetical protein